jgi:hypothetical protein
MQPAPAKAGAGILGSDATRHAATLASRKGLDASVTLHLRDGRPRPGWMSIHVVGSAAWGGLVAIFRPCPRDSLAGIVEIHLISLDAHELLAREQGGDAGRAAAHERVENALGCHVAADILDLRERARAGHRITLLGTGIGCEVYDMPILGQLSPQPGLPTPEDDGVPAQAAQLAVLLGVELATGDDAVILGEVFMPLIGLVGALPHEARAAVR